MLFREWLGICRVLLHLAAHCVLRRVSKLVPSRACSCLAREPRVDKVPNFGISNPKPHGFDLRLTYLLRNIANCSPFENECQARFKMSEQESEDIGDLIEYLVRELAINDWKKGEPQLQQQPRLYFLLPLSLTGGVCGASNGSLHMHGSDEC